MPDFAALDRLVAQRLPRWTEELLDFCRIPAEASQPDALRDAAAWTARRLGDLGATVELIERPGVPPLVIGGIGAGPRLLNLVQHYDVQPAVPLELWTTPPYEPDVRDGALYARGAADNKGELLARVWAIEAYLEALGALPCRVRFLVEGEEERGSPNLDRLLDLRPELRTADGALIEGGGIDAAGRPILECGVRGLLAVELTARTIAYDAHSSLAMLLPNAAARLATALASLFGADGRPAFEGWDAGVLPPTPAQLAVVDALPLDDLADLRRLFGVETFLAGRGDAEANRAATFEPTCNIQGLWSGYTGPGGNTITPAEAHARLDLRLVPEQAPAALRAALRKHLDAHGFGDIELADFEEAEWPYWSPVDGPIVAAARRASDAVFDLPAVASISGPGTAPMYQVCGRDRVPLVAIGGSHSGCRAHAPDEHYRLDLAARAVRVMARFLDEFAALAE
ncbi:MAG: M20/M25/M40 family metallo-hydrolase [Candidatus Limnocylindrales bacterium]